MSFRVLLTGFNKFGKHRENVSEQIIKFMNKKKYSDFDLVTQMFNTSYSECESEIKKVIENTCPDIILSLGISSKIDNIQMERIAVNIDDTNLKDNIQDLRRGSLIREDGPVAYFTTLNIQENYHHLVQKHNVTISNHAGTFVCNHLFYSTLYYLEKKNKKIPAGFIHIPDKFNQQISKNKVEEFLFELIIYQKEFHEKDN